MKTSGCGERSGERLVLIRLCVCVRVHLSKMGVQARKDLARFLRNFACPSGRMSALAARSLLLLSLLTATHAHAGCSCSRRAVMQGAAAAAAGGLWYPGKASAMVGGGLVSQGELDGLGLVGLATAAGGVCTGTRIGDGLVLTARHCTCSRAGPLEHAAFSGNLFAKNAVVRPIEDVITDEDGDLAIIRFKGHAPS